MSKLVQKSAYIKPGSASAYMKYIATREGVEKLQRNESWYMKYIATRPRVEKRGSHGLFSSADSVELSAAMSELKAHEGNVWTIIFSLRREDAARLGYDNAEAWRTLLMQHQHEMASAMKIPLDSFRWYAAFHDEGQHPHIHMMLWSDEPEKGYLTKAGIEAMRSKLTNTIFKDEMMEIFVRKDNAYKELTATAQNAMQELIHSMRHSLCSSQLIEENMLELIKALESVTGKKQYGYLKKPVKDLVNAIVDELASFPEVAACYKAWNDIRAELNSYYGESFPHELLPLSQRKEFRVIKNMVIREAENIRLGIHSFEDEAMRDEPDLIEPDTAKYRNAKSVLQDIYRLDAEHEEAIETMKTLWYEGCTEAAYQLGKFYRDDLSTMRDHEKAEHWFRASAELDDSASEYSLGKLLLSQKRVDEALHWLKKSAEHGNHFAEYALGKIYISGENIPKDTVKALEYLRASADCGNRFAQYSLGKLYLFGTELEQDRDKAREYFELSAAQGNEHAKFFLEHMDQCKEPSVLLAASKLMHHMSRIFQENSAPPYKPGTLHIYPKRRRRLNEKRMAMGHKADDHEEQIRNNPTLSM